MQNFIFTKIMILTFQSFNRREEKIKWTFIFPYRYDFYKQNNTDVFLIILTFDVLIFSRREERYNDKCFSILSKIKNTMLLLNHSVFRSSDVVLLLSIRK